MYIVAFGKITVATAGTPVAVTAADTPVYEMHFVQDVGNAAAKVFYKGTQFAPLAPTGASGMLDRQKICAPGGNPLNAKDFSVDVTTNGQGVWAYGVVE